MHRLKICSVVLLPALKTACSSAMIFSACGFNLFIMIFSMTLLGWLMRLIVFGSSGTAALLNDQGISTDVDFVQEK